MNTRAVIGPKLGPSLGIVKWNCVVDSSNEHCTGDLCWGQCGAELLVGLGPSVGVHLGPGVGLQGQDLVGEQGGLRLQPAHCAAVGVEIWDSAGMGVVDR